MLDVRNRFDELAAQDGTRQIEMWPDGLEEFGQRRHVGLAITEQALAFSAAVRPPLAECQVSHRVLVGSVNALQPEPELRA